MCLFCSASILSQYLILIDTHLKVGGNVFGLRESRSAAVQGPAVPTESNVLTDGTLIDLCGATLLWRSTEGKKILLLNEMLFRSLIF